MTSQKLLNELNKIVEEDYGITLSNDQTFLMAEQLTNLFEVLIYGKEVEKNGKTPEQNRSQTASDSGKNCHQGKVS